jgi:hypothetical protein
MVRAQVGYLNPEWKGSEERPKILSGQTRRANTSPRMVQIEDARPLQERNALDLDRSGFTLVRHHSSVRDFRDSREVRQKYFPEMAALLRRITGADQVFPHAYYQLRSENPESFLNAYSLYLHCDYAQRLSDYLRKGLLREHDSPLVDDAEGWSFAWYNIWRPIEREVQKNPLTIIDASTLDPADVVEYHPAEGGDNMVASLPVYNEGQRLYYFSRMQTDEVLVFKQLDSRPDRAQVCPHTSFEHPNTPRNALERRSIELRMMCAFAPA